MMRNQGTTDSIGSEAAVLGNGESHKNQKLKDKMCNGGGGGAADADSWLASWPPRHYTCNFCRRRFKSAQALGGHMNVHRRARAMLRSQSISPISSPPSSPWLPASSITTSTGQTHQCPRPFQNDEHYFLYPYNPNLNYRPSNNPHHINPANQSNLSYLPTSCSSILTSIRAELPAPAFKHMPEGGQCHHAELISNRERAKKNCIRADQNNLNGLCSSWRRMIHQDDVVSRLSLGTGLITTRPAMEEDIDLELRL